MLKVGRQRAYQLTLKPTFPAPIGELGGLRVWLTQEVERWIAHNRQ